ncbi:MAG: DUF3047 domain-containing protein [Burkholderiaceae bacterium]
MPPSCLLIAVLACAAGLGPARAEGALLAPFSIHSDQPAQPWHVLGLPRQTKPFTRFSVVDIDGRRALRVEAEESYGNLVHPLKDVRPNLKLAWRWRVDTLIVAANLRTKAGDDVALKVCVFFDEPMESVPFVERQLLRLARSQSEQDLPSATVCYVWDVDLPPGTTLHNAFTSRLRYMVLRSGTQYQRQWVQERRDIGADFLELFGTEVTTLPPVIGVAVGADADNTRSRSLGFVSDLVLQP